MCVCVRRHEGVDGCVLVGVVVLDFCVFASLCEGMLDCVNMCHMIFFMCVGGLCVCVCVCCMCLGLPLRLI